MNAFRQVIRAGSKVVFGIAVLVFLRTSFTKTGSGLTVGSLLVGVACVVFYMWAKPDNDGSENSN
jgi:hypothetical protein